MGDRAQRKPVNHICVGLLAHVDAGKTTLAEAILFQTGQIRTLGRVDHQNAFLDHFEQERERGITIFSKQAQIALGETQLTLMDTPGHVDFSAEMERTLQILDYAILVISGAAGLQSHAETLWRLLNRYQIPVILFINKMDQPGTDRQALMQELTRRLDNRCVDFTAIEEGLRQETSPERTQKKRAAPEEVKALRENLAMCEEALLERYLDGGEITQEDVARLIRERKLFPCYFGSALHLEGVEEMLSGLQRFCRGRDYPQAFGARVFKITRDNQGNRLTHLRITGGRLKVKDVLSGKKAQGAGGNGAAYREGAGGRPDKAAHVPEPDGTGAAAPAWEQKVNQIRIYSGENYQTVSEAEAGTICAVTGLEETYAGEGLGGETEAELPLLEPVLSYRIETPPGCDAAQLFLKLRQLEEEEPQLHLVWEERLSEIHVQLMGEVQTEVLRSLIRKRFGVWVTFGPGHIVYKETIANTVEGMGHFEPLRHYAEVHLLLEPAERGSGLQFAADCSEDVLDRNWQRLVLTHLAEKRHRGVLTGSELTDVKITLVAGRAHQKHTEGGDFRQATYRAVRQGLKCARSVLLEPFYAFRLEVPQQAVGHAMSDLKKLGASFSSPELTAEYAVLCGKAPVAAMQGYQAEVLSYTKGRGRLSCTFEGYENCHNAEEVIAAIGYDSEQDLENPAGSVFCAHGAGYVVPWDQVRELMQVESGLHLEGQTPLPVSQASASGQRERGRAGTADEKELQEIFARTYGSGSETRKRYAKSRKVEFFSSDAHRPAVQEKQKNQEKQEDYLLVDGYNIIFAWEDLRALAQENIDAARDRLMDILSNYQGWKKVHLILVFDAYKVPGGQGSVLIYHNIYVVYTKEAETADQYIEKTVRRIGGNCRITVATSDALEQVIILGAGAVRMSASGLKEEMEQMQQELQSTYLNPARRSARNFLLDQLPPEKAAQLRENLKK